MASPFFDGMNEYRPKRRQSQPNKDFPANFFGQSPGPETGLAVPHVVSLQSIIGTQYGTYFQGAYDEALRDSQENADAMRNDPFVRRLMDERKLSVCSLRYSIEVDDERDQYQKALKDGLTKQWEAIPNKADLLWYLMEAEWYGRYGGQMSYHYKEMNLPALPRVGGVVPGLPAILGMPSGYEKRRALTVKTHLPYEGDKIGYDYSGCPYVLVAAQAETSLKTLGAEVAPWPPIFAKNMEYGYTTAGGLALFLRSPSWRQRFAIHKGEVLDGPFMSADKGDQIHGIGIRSVIYWYWWLRDEFLCNVTDWCARTGLGVRLWYYDASNPASEAAVSQAARDQDDKVNIMIPRYPGSEAQEGVDFVDTSGTGANLLLEIVRWAEEHIELYVVGQSMSKGAQESSSGFGDRGRVDFARNTKWQITKRSAQKLGETITTDIIDVMKRWSYPKDYWDIPARFVFHVDTPDPGEWIKAAQGFIEMGGTIVESEARAVLGFSEPNSGDKVLGGIAKIPGMGGGGVPMDESGNPVVPKPESRFAGDAEKQPAPAPEQNGHSNGKVRL